MKRNRTCLVLALAFVLIAGPLTAQGNQNATVKKDTGAVKTETKTKKKTSAKKKAVTKADSLKSKPVKFPRLVDLGAGKCIPCKMMAPILEGLEKDFQGKLEVIFIDVWKNPGEGEKYNIRAIPTQIFYSPEGKELFRHEGFYSREDILKRWKELGYDFSVGTEKEKKP